MILCTSDDLKLMVSTSSELDRLISDDAELDELIFNKACKAGSDYVNAYVNVVNNASNLAKQFACQIALYHLFMRVNAKLPESIGRMYADALDRLKDLDKHIIENNDIESIHPRTSLTVHSKLPIDTYYNTGGY